MNVPGRQPIALVTGSGRKRIGNLVARDLAEAGYHIALHYNSSAEAAEETVAELQGAGTEAEAYRADVSVEDQVDAMFDSVMQRFGQLDVLVTTASIWGSEPLESISVKDLQRNWNVNTLGTFLCARRAGLIMAQQTHGGAIVTIGDWAVQRPYRDHAAYFISKGAIPTMTRVLAVEFAQRNPSVRVNCIHPGPVMFPPSTSKQEQHAMVRSTLVKQADCPSSISQAVRFLIEDKFVTGVCLPVDGGRTIYSPDV